MYNWVGKFKLFILFFSWFGSSVAVYAESNEFKFESSKWEDFSYQVEQQKEKDRKNGLSYVISGSLALVGGLLGNGMSDDAAEKGIYTIFQTIGIASIGYGAYRWQIGGEERSLYQTLQYSNLTPIQKTQFLKAYLLQKADREKRDRLIRAITHSLIAALNFYNASTQKQDGLKNTLYFIGGANLLAAISFTFEF